MQKGLRHNGTGVTLQLHRRCSHAVIAETVKYDQQYPECNQMQRNLFLICSAKMVHNLKDAVMCSSTTKYLDFTVSLLRVLLGLNILLAQTLSLVLEGC